MDDKNVTEALKKKESKSKVMKVKGTEEVVRPMVIEAFKRLNRHLQAASSGLKEK